MQYIPRKVQFTPEAIIKLREYIEAEIDSDSVSLGSHLHADNAFEVFESSEEVIYEDRPGALGTKMEKYEYFIVSCKRTAKLFGSIPVDCIDVRMDKFQAFLRRTGFYNKKQYYVS